MPGGRIEPFESITEALIREVKEETGLRITEIEGVDTRVETGNINPDFVVECIRPFAVYQTIKGPVDSTGFYFRCRGAGDLLRRGDGTEKPQWVKVEKVRSIYLAFNRPKISKQGINKKSVKNISDLYNMVIIYLYKNPVPLIMVSGVIENENVPIWTNKHNSRHL